MLRLLSAIVLFFSVTSYVVANNNELAELPPMGWRSWNLYGANVNQQLIEGIMDGMVSKKRTVNGVPTSLCDLGYCDVGLDDNWQNCHGGADGNNYHDADGNPVVNHDRFPDMKKMTDHAHSLGLTAGWYGNNCICADRKSGDRKFYEGDAKALIDFGFDGYKLDGCGAQTDMQLWDDIFKAANKAVMVENCHWGSKVPYEPNATWCPWNFYRSSGDVRASFSSIIGNLNTVTKFSHRNLSYPGCWAYPDMLEVGCQHGPGGKSDPGLTMAETRTHFGAWVVVSSPLTLSHDVNNDTVMDQVWPIISNKEAIAISQTYAGFSGGPFLSSQEVVHLDKTNPARMTRNMSEQERQATGPTLAASFQYFYKPLNYEGGSAAVLLINADSETQQLSLNFSDVPGLKGPCDVRDIWEQKDLGTASSKSFSVGSHDSVFLKLSGCTAVPPIPATFNVVNMQSGKCLDIYGGDETPHFPADESQAQLFACNGGDNQLWTLKGKALVNPASGKCLDVNNAHLQRPGQIPDQTKVQLYDCNGLWNQQWEVNDGQLVNIASGKCLDIYGGGESHSYPADQAKVQLYTCSEGKTNQAWELKQ
jgi:alpha-galactosidase